MYLPLTFFHLNKYVSLIQWHRNYIVTVITVSASISLDLIRQILYVKYQLIIKSIIADASKST